MIEWVDIPDEDAFVRLVLQRPTPVVVAFETDDCDHCRQQRSLLALAWQQLDWTAPTLRVDATRLPQLAERHRIAGYPTITVFEEGRLIEHFPGRRSPEDLTRRLSRLFGSGGQTAAAGADVSDEPGWRRRMAPRALAGLISAPDKPVRPVPLRGPLIVRMEPAVVLDDKSASRGSGDQDSCACAACGCPA